MIKAMKALYWVMKENIALRKWHSLKDLLGQCSVDLSPLDYAGNVKYDSRVIIAELVEAMAIVVSQDTQRLINESTFCGILKDETTDASNLGILDLHLRLVKNGVVTSRFGTVLALPGRTADIITGCVKEWCTGQQIPLTQAHFGSDGSSTFTGIHNGVVARLKRNNPTAIGVHCVCHHKALAA